MYLLDTNILIAYFEKENQIVTLVEKWIREDLLNLSCVTVAEFLVRATNEQQILLWELEDRSPIVFLDKEIVIKAVNIRRSLLTKRNRIVLLDCLIAATALVNDWTLVTRNVRHFKSISGLKLKVI